MMLAYVMSKFPVVTETFILYEILEIERLGFQVEVRPLRRVSSHTVHPEAAAMLERAKFLPLLSPAILAACVRALLKKPRRLIGALASILVGTWGSWKDLAAGCAYFPKCVRMAEELEANGVRHVHAHFANHPALAAWIVNRLTGIGYSFTAHATDIQVNHAMLDRKIADSAFAVTVSEHNLDYIRGIVGEELARKVRIVHCGVDLDLFERGHEIERVDEQPLELLCVGRLMVLKGHRHLINACARLNERGVNFVCRLIGEGPLEAELRAQAIELGIADRIRFEGARPRLEVLSRLRTSDIFVLTSVRTPQGSREGIPVALMEAMACGRPVVASRLSGIPELVEDGVSGLLTEPGDVSGVAEAIERLAGDPALRAAMGTASRKKVEAEFDLKSNARQLAALLLEYSPDLRADGALAGEA